MKPAGIESNATITSMNEDNLEDDEEPLRRLRSKPIPQISSHKRQNDWNSFNFFGCCTGQPSPGSLVSHNRKVNVQLKDSTARAIAHYQISDTSSFLEIQKSNSEPNGNSTTSKRIADRKFYNPKIPFPQEELFLLGAALEKVLCKIEIIRLQSSSQTIQSKTSLVNVSKNLKGSKMGLLGQQNELIIDPVADYIAQLCGNMVLIDGLCGSGANAVQFARHCCSLVAIEADAQKIKEARNNARVYDVEHKIDFVQARFLQMRKLKADVVFLAPTELKHQPHEQFSVFLHICEDIQKIIEHALDVAPNICIKLPCYTNPKEIGALFARIYSNNPKVEASHRFTLKIQQIEIDNIPDCIIVYFGAFSQIKEIEIKEFLYELATKCNDPALKTEYHQTLVCTLIKTLGIQFIVEAILNFQNQGTNTEENKSLLKCFFDKAMGIEAVSTRLLFELKHNPDLTAAFESSGIFIDFSPVQTTTRESILTNRLSHKAHFAPSLEDLSPRERSSVKKKSQRVNFNLHVRDLSMSGVSDLALSSYSLRSGALLDSDDGSPMSKKVPSFGESDLVGLMMKHTRTRSTGSCLGLIREEASTPTSDKHDSVRMKRNGSSKLLNLRFA